MKQFRANILLLLAALIWGIAFIAQSVSMNYIGPFLFNGIRFALGSLVLIAPAFLFRDKTKTTSTKATLIAGAVCGTVLFFAASLQQIGIIYTTVGKAGFITCFYIVLVPLAGIFLGQKTGISVWSGCALALCGLYLLAVHGEMSIAYGDLMVFICAFFFAAHILVIDHFVKSINAVLLACTQFAVCAAWNMLASVSFGEPMVWQSIYSAGPAILYAGVISAGIAYTLQVIGQKDAEPAQASIILSMETVFAALAGWLVLGEQLSRRELSGCALLLCGMLVAQVGPIVEVGVRKTFNRFG